MRGSALAFVDEGLAGPPGLVSRLLLNPGMSTERTVRLGYRGYLVEVSTEQRPDGMWGAKWMVFATRPFLPRRHVVSPSGYPSEERARSGAVTQALRWIDAEIPAAAPATVEAAPLATTGSPG